MSIQRASDTGRSGKAVALQVVMALLLALLVPVAGLVIEEAPADAVGGPPRAPMADPDTARSHDGTYYATVGTTLSGYGNCGEYPVYKSFRVPVIKHTNSINISGECIEHDALPYGPGSWADPNQDIWAPSIVKVGSTAFMYYSATKLGTGNPGHKCLGRAISVNGSIEGPYANGTEFACPPNGRWAIDADAFLDGPLYVVYRDDAITTGNQTGISVVQANAYGLGMWETRRSVLVSTQVSWDYAARTNTHVIENPSMFRTADNNVWLFYSGNDFATNEYGTGIAHCGTTVIGPYTCTPIDRTDRPYFGYSGRAGPDPFKLLPLDKPGPGGMSVWLGGSRAVWHWWVVPRQILMGSMVHNGGGNFTIT